VQKLCALLTQAVGDEVSGPEQAVEDLVRQVFAAMVLFQELGTEVENMVKNL